MTTDTIIDACLTAIAEVDVDAPVDMSRATCLAHINHAYQQIMGPILNNQKSAILTFTSGIATLPTDYLQAMRVEDDGTVLTQIFDIKDRVETTDTTSQYWIPNETQIYIYGATPTGVVTMYYRAAPTALTDSSASSPSALKGKFHTAFIAYIKSIIARDRDNLNDYYLLNNEWLDSLDEIEVDHDWGRHDNEPFVIKGKW